MCLSRFENVFQIVTSNVWKKEGLEGLPVHHILKCRQVCSHWNFTIDKLIDEKFACFEESSKDGFEVAVGKAFKVVRSTVYNNYSVSASEAIHKFLHHFQDTHSGGKLRGRNPLVWPDFEVNIKAIVYDDENQERQDRFLEGISILLLKYGSHLQHFKMESYDISIFRYPTTILRKWLLRVPNLKILTLLGNMSSSWQLYEMNEMRLAYYREGNPIPKLERLEHIIMHFVPAPVVNQLIKQNNQITALVVDRLCADYNFFTFPLSNLKKLEVQNCSNKIIEKFGSPEVQWDLESLTLNFCHGKLTECASLFQVIEDKFGSTLVSLDLKALVEAGVAAVGGAVWQDCKNFRFNMPQLKKLEFSLSKRPVCLDFLLPVKDNLEEISVEVLRRYLVSNRDANKPWSIVQFSGYENQMLESNIWEIFSKLKKITINLDKSKVEYTREDYVQKRLQVL